MLNPLPALGLILALGLSLIGLLEAVGAQGVQPQDALGSAFTYQGQLVKDGNAVNDTCDFQFSLWDAASDGNQVGSTQTISGVTVDDGYFGVSLNSGNEFGSNAFTGEARYLQIAARCTADSDFVSLSGRVALNATPYALYATSAPWSGLTDVPAGFADGVDNTSGDYQNVIVVAKSGGHFATIQSALDSIGDNNAANRYLVWVAPATYTETVTMKPYVDIQGAGELATRITATGSASANTGTVIGADNTELRFLTVENTGGDDYAIAIYNNSASPHLTHITATASEANEAGGQNYGVYNDASSPVMTHVTATALGLVSQANGSDGYGVYNRNNSSPTMTNVTVTGIGTAGYGVYNDASSPAMADMVITAQGIVGSGVHNRNNSSPTMMNLTITGGGSYDCSGVHNNASSPTMTNVIINIWGLFGVYGVHNNTSSPTMTDVTIIVDGTDNVYGVYNNTSSLTMTNVAITAIGENTDGIGIHNWADGGSYTVTVNNSQITSGLNTIANDAEFTTLVGASQLAGGAVTGGGTVTCAGVYDENYTFYPNTCP